MYKKNDFSREAMRASELTQCGENGELGAIVWFGTKSWKAALRKLHKVASATNELGLKKFPEIKTKKK